jgi:cell division protein FtsB
MKIIALIILSALIVFLCVQIYLFWTEKGKISGEFEEVKSKLNETKVDQARLQAELDYLANPANLEKEIRARFNLKKPGEKTIIIIPEANPSSASSSSNR